MATVRAALRILESRGLIEGRGNGTFAVATLRNRLNQGLHLLLAADEADATELFEVRRILEGESAALAATRRTNADVRAMQAALDAMESGLGSEESFIEADLRFHLRLAQATRNRVVMHLMHAIRDLLQQSLSSSYHIPGSPEREIGSHSLIIEAIAAKRPDEARERMQEHVTRVERDIRSKGKRRG